jgi:hypothetical protein
VDSLNLLRWMSAFSMVTLLLVSYWLEGPVLIHDRLVFVYNDRMLLFLVVTNCCGAFMVNLTQFLVRP